MKRKQSTEEQIIGVRRVTRGLTNLIRRRGKPNMIIFVHGTEFTSNAILA